MKHELAPGTLVRTLAPKPDYETGLTDKERSRRRWGCFGKIGYAVTKTDFSFMYGVLLEGDEYRGPYHPDEFEVLADKCQPFYVDLGPLDVLQEGDQLLLQYTFEDAFERKISPTRWARSDGHHWTLKLSQIQDYFGAARVIGARRLITPR